MAFRTVSNGILAGNSDATAVTTAMKTTLMFHMRKSPALFQKTLQAFIERLITLEVEEAYLRNFYLLLTRIFSEFIKPRDRTSKSSFYLKYAP